MTAANDRPTPRRLAAADAAACAALHERLFSPAWNETSFRLLLSEPTTEALGIGAGPAALSGFLIGRVAADEAEIITVGVASPSQRQGWAGILVAEFIATLRRRGVKCVHLEVAEDNAAARALYARAGFTEVGRRRGYYVEADPAGRDALILALEL